MLEGCSNNKYRSPEDRVAALPTHMSNRVLSAKRNKDWRFSTTSWVAYWINKQSGMYYCVGRDWMYQPFDALHPMELDRVPILYLEETWKPRKPRRLPEKVHDFLRLLCIKEPHT